MVKTIHQKIIELLIPRLKPWAINDIEMMKLKIDR